ncbi:MAG: RIP metalloprotease RseP [Proteobacteria bacterium]|nr:RIP metalloprotease RseP [Pseudomonadota bacterium]
MITIVSFIIILGVLIFIHEFGHFIVAKWLGVRVEKFSLGFGPKLIGFKRKKTEYLLSLFPLGGYVKLAGEEPGEELKNDPSEFSSRSVADRVKIVVAGPVMNLILAGILFPIVFMMGTQVPAYVKKPPVIGWIENGSPAEEAGFKREDSIERIDGATIKNWGELENFIITNPGSNLVVSFLRDGVFMERGLTPSTNRVYGTGYAGMMHQIDPIIHFLTPNYPAAAAGLKPGDRILYIDDEPVYHWNQVSQLIQKHGKEEETVFVVQRETEKLSFFVKPRLEEINGEKRLFIGISPFMEMMIEKYGFFESLKKGTQKMFEMTGMTFYVLKNLVTRKLSVKTLGGPIMIAQMTGQAAKAGMSTLLFFMAFLSLSLGILNLLPIPVLDGGHILFLGIEFIRGKPLGVKKIEIAQQIGLAILILLMVVVTYNDIQRVLPENISKFIPWR